jgi:hypothetical protein
MRYFAMFLLLAASFQVRADWDLVQSPSNETFNGISSSPDGRFRVAVGNSGTIVHFTEDSPNGAVVASGTSNDLFDVHVVSEDFAAASGRDVVLKWDGAEWTTIVANPGLYLPVWATPEKDYIIYNLVSEGGPFNYRLSWDVKANQAVPGAYAGPLDLTYCGNSSSVLALNENGDFRVMQGNLGSVNELGLIHDENTPLSLTAAFIPPNACLSGGFLPPSAFAINFFKQIWQWDGSTWSDTGVSIPANQTLSWISGSGPGHVLVAGYEPSADINNPGNKAVIWQKDGLVWGPVVTSATPELPGLTDVVVISFQDTRIFANSLEQSPSVCTDISDSNCTPPEKPSICVPSGSGNCDAMISSAEEGDLVISDSIVPAKDADLFVQGKVLNIGDLSETQNTAINYGLIVGNNGPDTAEGVNLKFIDFTQSLTVLDCPDFTRTVSGEFSTFVLNGNLPAGETRTCEVTVIAEPSYTEPVTWKGRLFAQGYLEETDRNLRNQAISCLLPQGRCFKAPAFGQVSQDYP